MCDSATSFGFRESSCRAGVLLAGAQRQYAKSRGVRLNTIVTTKLLEGFQSMDERAELYSHSEKVLAPTPYISVLEHSTGVLREAATFPRLASEVLQAGIMIRFLENAGEKLLAENSSPAARHECR